MIQECLHRGGHVDLTDLGRSLRLIGAGVVSIPPTSAGGTGPAAASRLRRVLEDDPAGLFVIWGPALERALAIRKSLKVGTVVVGLELGWLPQREWMLTDGTGMWNRAATRTAMPSVPLSKTAGRAVDLLRAYYRRRAQDAEWEGPEVDRLEDGYLFVPLQMEGDKAVRRGLTAGLAARARDLSISWGRPQGLHLALIATIAEHTDRPIVARLHPKEARTPHLLDRLRKGLRHLGLDRRAKVFGKSNSYVLMSLAAGVAGLSSTMLAEALAADKPTAVLGEAFCSGMPGLFDARDPRRLRTWPMTFDPPAAAGTLWDLLSRQIPSGGRRQFVVRANPYLDAIVTRAGLFPDRQPVSRCEDICLHCPYSNSGPVPGKFNLGDDPPNPWAIRCHLCGCLAWAKTRASKLPVLHRADLVHCPIGAW